MVTLNRLVRIVGVVTRFALAIRPSQESSNESEKFFVIEGAAGREQGQSKGKFA